MQAWIVWLLGISVGVALIAAWAWSARLRSTVRSWQRTKLHELFCQQRDEVISEYLRLGRSSDKPRGLRLANAEWEPEGTLARDRQHDLYVMLVPVALKFTPIQGGDMEGVAATELAKQATAVFYFDRGRWHASDRTIFNLSPKEALTRQSSQLEPLD